MNGEHKAEGGIQPALLTAAAAAQVLNVSERTFNKLRSNGMVPKPVVLGPRILRWVHTELLEHAANLPRQTAPAPMPLQLRKVKPGSNVVV